MICPFNFQPSADIVVVASGPFRIMVQALSLIESCLAAKIHYLDLADGADFVAGVTAYNGRQKGHFYSFRRFQFSVLTALVVRELSKDMTSIGSIYRYHRLLCWCR